MSADLDSFRGVRLGVLERTVLCNAPPQGSFSGLPIIAPEKTRSAQQGYLRATKKLTELGLIVRVRMREATRADDSRLTEPQFAHGRFWIQPNPTRRQIVNRIYAWSTPFGEGIKIVYERELTSGSPIRWSEKNLALARRYEHVHPCDSERHEQAVELIEARLLEDPDTKLTERFKEWLPEDGMTSAQKLRWHCAAHLAHRSNRRLGSSGLWKKALELYGSESETAVLQEKAGPLPGQPAVGVPLRFTNVELVGPVLTAAGRQALERSSAADRPGPGAE